MDTDGQGRIFVLALTRLMDFEEKKVGVEYMFMSPSGAAKEIKVDINVDPDKTDLYQILVFDHTGKILASRRLNVHANNIRIFKDRLFLIDTQINMNIHEYEFSFN